MIGDEIEYNIISIALNPMKSFLLLLISACEVGLVILQKDANATIAIAAALNITRRVGFYD